MPYIFSKNQKPFKKPKYQVTNWPEYNVALRKRGDITIWFSNDAISRWSPKKSDYQGIGQPTYDLIEQLNPSAQVTIKPPKNSLPPKEGNAQRSAHIDMIRRNGRGRWRLQTGYGRRSLVEVAMLRYKTIIGNKMKARKLPRQIAEAQVSVRVLNKMTQLGMPATVRVA